MNNTMRTVAKSTIIGLAVAGIAAGSVVMLKRDKKPHMKQSANKALKAAGNFIDQLTQLTD
ncbi:MAG TPA: hypothetical protein DCY74_01065 [Clostridiales bacterium]|nr:hypothetical protein [Clostridiales bacterium]HBE12737.1 hypothetical protein [Clostridiales bacterium]HCG35120.1 hypothetical protein [Clostridiales bacterium]